MYDIKVLVNENELQMRIRELAKIIEKDFDIRKFDPCCQIRTVKLGKF